MPDACLATDGGGIMSVTQVTLLSGPAAVSYAGHLFWARDGVLVSPALELSPVESDANGELDSSVADAPVTIQFVPSAPASDLVALYPHLAGAPGSSLFGPTDVPLVITAANGMRLSFAAVALTQMPDLSLGAAGAAAGTVSFLALPARASAAGDPTSVVVLDTATLPAFPTSSPQLSDDYVLTWGGAPWAALRSRDGFAVRLVMKTAPVISDANALLDLTLAELAVEVRFVPGSPGGPAEADALAALQLQGRLPGRPLSGGAQELSITGDALALTLPEAQIVRADLAFAANRGRVGEVTLASCRAFLTAAEALAVVRD
jgi:hypothetical protein